MRSVKVLIVGAGPCGLGTATEMLESGPGGEDDFLLVDSRQKPGGWASSHTTPEGFTFDYGGHVLFPHKKYPAFGAMLKSLPIAWSASVPQRGVRVNGRFLPYPAQRNLQRLPLARLARVLASVMKQRASNKVSVRVGRTSDSDMESYLLGHFGSYVTELLMEPLNRKQWAHPIEALTDVWVTHCSGSKTPNVANMDPARIMRNLLLQRDDPGWTPETRVTYPREGGSGAIWSAVAARIPREKMLLGTRISALSLTDRTALLSDGETVRWENLVSSMPIDMLLRMVEEEQPKLAGKAERFVCARSRLFGFGIRGTLPTSFEGLHSCQVTDADVPFWRLNFPMNVSPGNGPEGCYSLLCEVSEPTSQPPFAELRAQVQVHLYRMGLLGCSGQRLISSMETTVEHGYPVPFLGRDALLSEVQPLLEQAGVYSRGRFGSWRYEISNQDHAYMQGVEIARRVLFGIPEETFQNSVVVNQLVPIHDFDALTIPQNSDAVSESTA